MKPCCEFQIGIIKMMIPIRKSLGSGLLVVAATFLLIVAGGTGCGSRGGEPPSPAPRVGVGEAGAAAGERTGDYRNLAPGEFRDYLQEHPGGFLLDVRRPEEWDDELGHLDGAVLIPDDEVRARLDELPADHDTPIMLYCRSGRRSSRVAWELVLEGYTTVINLDGGLLAYRDEIY